MGAANVYLTCPFCSTLPHLAQLPCTLPPSPCPPLYQHSLHFPPHVHSTLMQFSSLQSALSLPPPASPSALTCSFPASPLLSLVLAFSPALTCSFPNLSFSAFFISLPSLLTSRHPIRVPTCCTFYVLTFPFSPPTQPFLTFTHLSSSTSSLIPLILLSLHKKKQPLTSCGTHEVCTVQRKVLILVSNRLQMITISSYPALYNLGCASVCIECMQFRVLICCIAYSSVHQQG